MLYGSNLQLLQSFPPPLHGIPLLDPPIHCLPQHETGVNLGPASNHLKSLYSLKLKRPMLGLEENAASLRTQLDQQKGVVDNLVNNTRILESKIQEAKSKKDTLKALAQSAKTATKVSEMLGNVNTSSALSTFEKMEEKSSISFYLKTKQKT
uniref:Uncharacterized protein n=1 Tax=Lactuca sativa TaxID=4236 RepID=A0A9R1VBN9_LACSA|nr:hypothetical protein LSAT_V11C500273560 [Lactuca sativa]